MFSSDKRVSSSIPYTKFDSRMEEKFDYTDSEFELTFEKQGSVFPLKFHDFMATLVGKRKLLAEAEAFDKSRGVVLSKEEDENLNEELKYSMLEEQNQNYTGVIKKTDPEVVSDEFSKAKNDIRFEGDQQMSSTPYVNKPAGTSIEDQLLFQSTPLSKPKISSGTQPRDLLKEKILDSNRRSVSESSSVSRKPRELREELSKFKDGLSNIDKIRLDHEKQIKQLMDALEKKENELKQTKKDLALKAHVEEAMKENVESMKKAYVNLSDKLKRNEENESTMKGKLTSLEQDLITSSNRAKESIDSLTLKLEVEKQNSANLLAEISKHKLKNEEQSGTINQKINEITNLQSTVDGLHKRLRELTEEKELLSSEFLQYKCKMENLEENFKVEKDNYENKIKDYNDLKISFANLKKDYEQSVKKLEQVSIEKTHYETFVQHLKIFGIDLGKIIFPKLRTDDELPELDNVFSSLNIIGFKTNEDEELIHRIQNEIEIEWRQKLEEKLEENSLLRETIDSKNEKITNLLDKVSLLEESKESLLAKNEQFLNEIADFQDKITSCELSNLTEKKNAFTELSTQNLELLEKFNSAKEELSTKSNELSSTTELLKNERERSVKLRNNLEQSENTVTNLKKSLEKLRGNLTERITPESLFKIHKHMDRTSYQLLELENIESLNLVECQNALKNIIAILDIPYSKFSTKLPLVNIMLRYEKTICFHFANRVHYLLFHGEIDSKTYTKKALENYWTHRNAKLIEHPLEKCLNDLYETVRQRLLV